MTSGLFPPLFARLHVLDDSVLHPAALNMALDETLLTTLAETPVLRIYRWERPAVSFGYFESWRETATRFPGRELVRRWTGGGAVEHGTDFTYSLTVPRNENLTNLPAGESYHRIHRALAACLLAAGEQGTELSEQSVARGRSAGVRECFAEPVLHDLMRAGRKLGGAAQRRTRQGLLHQGSLLQPGWTTLDHARVARLLPGFLGAEFSTTRLPEDQQAQAERLALDKYASLSWLRMR